RRVLDEVGDGAYLRRGGGDRGDDVRARNPRGHVAADDQLPTSRPCLRPRLRAQRGAQGAHRCCAIERNGAGRPQRVRPLREGGMSFIVEPRVEEYAEAHSSPDGELFERLAAETREKSDAPQMMVGLLEGQFLGALVRSTGAKRILELGTFTGYSSISMALALPEGGRLITCDVNLEKMEIARRYATEDWVDDRIV